MYIKIVTRLYDDKNVECKEDDTVLIETKKSEEPIVATIKELQTHLLIAESDNPLLGTTLLRLRPEEIKSITRMNEKSGW